jgi:hypothetical protein
MCPVRISAEAISYVYGFFRGTPRLSNLILKSVRQRQFPSKTLKFYNHQSPYHWHCIIPDTDRIVNKLHSVWTVCLFVFGATAPPPQWARASPLTRFLDQTQRRTTVGRTPLDEWSIRRTDLYLTTNNTHDKHPCPRWDSNQQSQQGSGRRPTP